jgi:hypothetical protein
MAQRLYFFVIHRRIHGYPIPQGRGGGGWRWRGTAGAGG